MNGPEDLLRRLSPRFVRQYRGLRGGRGRSAGCPALRSDALAGRQHTGWADAWLITVAARQLTDQLRSARASKRREATAEIARAFLVPESTMAQRITRAKQKIKASGTRFTVPPDMQAVLHVRYQILDEGYTASTGMSPHRADLVQEAIPLTRAVRVLLPEDVTSRSCWR